MSAQDPVGRKFPAPRRPAWVGCLLVAVFVPGAYVSIAVGLGLVVSQPVLATLITDVVAATGVLLARWRRPDWFAFDPVPPGRDRIHSTTAADRRWACLAVVCLGLAFGAGQVSAMWIGAIAGAVGPTDPSSTASAPPAVVGVTFTLLVAPVAEEALMRGLMYPLLRRFMPPVPAVVLVTLCFAALHGNVHQSIATIGLGLLLALVYEHTRRLWPVVALHALFNALALLVPVALLGRLAGGPAMMALIVAFGAVLCLLVHRTVRRSGHRSGSDRPETDKIHDRQGQR